MTDLDELLQRRRNLQVEEFTAWLREQSPDELNAYAAELEAFAGDETKFGAFAASALPLVRRVAVWVEARELLRPGFEAACPDADLDAFWDAARVLSNASRQLGEDPLGTDADVLELGAAALEVAQARSEGADQ